jgi:hypothetical protein
VHNKFRFVSFERDGGREKRKERGKYKVKFQTKRQGKSQGKSRQQIRIESKTQRKKEKRERERETTHAILSARAVLPSPGASQGHRLRTHAIEAVSSAKGCKFSVHMLEDAFTWPDYELGEK